MFLRWRGHDPDADQVINALDAFVDLTPVSEARANATKANWAAWIPGKTIPLIGERRYDVEQEEL